MIQDKNATTLSSTKSTSTQLTSSENTLSYSQLPAIYENRLSIYDKITGWTFMIDTGAQLSIIPNSNRSIVADRKLYAQIVYVLQSTLTVNTV